MKKLCLLFSAATLFFACSQPSSTENAADTFQLDSAKAAIAAANMIFEDALAKGDSAASAALYTKDGCILQSGMPKICGSAAIASFFGGAKKMGVGGIKLTTIDVSGSKELVAEEGNYELLGLDGKTIDKGKYLLTWKLEDGKWKIARDISNTDLAPAPAAAEKK